MKNARLLFISLLIATGCGRMACAGLNANSTVFVILMENENGTNVIANANAPYINNTLLPTASYATQYYTPPGNHPSEPNYLWLEAGTNFGILNDNPPAQNHQSTTSHFVTQLHNAGISWKAYQESIDGSTCPTSDNGEYAVRHDPFVFFDDIVNSYCTTAVRPFSELANDISNNTLAHYNFITPNVCDDMHDSCAPTNNMIQQGDNWLSQNLPTILNSSAYQSNGLVIIVWDEGSSGSDGPIPCIILSPLAKGGGYHNSIYYTHSATLRTLQKIFGVTPFLNGAASSPDLSDLFASGAIPNSDSPTVTTTSASNVSGGNATLGGSVNANGNLTQTWFEYGLTTSYGSNTISSSTDNAESYSSWSYGSTGGSGLGPATYLEGSGGGIFLVNNGTDAGRQIDGNNSFGVFAGGGSGNSQGMDRQILNAQQAGTLTISCRFDVNNNSAFSGFNLKSAQSSPGNGSFGANELISVGIHPSDGNNTIAINGGNGITPHGQIINLGTDLRGQIIDFVLTYDGLSGTYTLGAKLRSSSNFTYASGPLKASNVTPSYLGFGNFNTGNNQNAIFDSISISDSGSAGNGTTPVSTSATVTGLTPNTTYHYRAVAEDSAGTIAYGADQTFGFPLVPPANATYHSTNSSSGNFQARIYDATGHIALAEPDLSGNPLANLITFAPPSAKINGASYDFGAIQSVTNISNGLQIVQSFAGSTITAQLTFSSDGVMHYEVTNWNGFTPTETDVTAASDSSEHFYGFGEKFNTLDQSNNTIHIIPSDIGGNKGDNSYKSSPWFLSTRGYGFHLDSTAESYFNMHIPSAGDRYTVQNLIGTDTIHSWLKFNIVPGPKLTDALSRYTGYTGRPYLPPPWVFGTWISSDIWRTGGEVRYAITKYVNQYQIPASVFVFDSPWEVSYNDFTWNMGQWNAGGTYEGTNYNGFSSVTDMMTFLQQNGVKVVCWFTPFLNTSSNNEGIPGQNTGKSPNYDTAANNGYLVKTSTSNSSPLSVGWWKGSGSPIDFTNAAANNWFLTTQLQPLVNGSNVATMNGGQEPAIGGFKTDDGEAVQSDPNHPYIPKTAAYSDGRTGTEMQNGYSQVYHGTVSSSLGSSGILFSRSGFTGTGAFPAGWPGDNLPNYSQSGGLQSVITAGDSAAMSGYSIWGHDIGGYINGAFENDRADLFMRWSQYGAFSPIMQMHRQVDSSNLQQYPWGYGNNSFGASALTNYVTYAKLHSQLFPYIYTYAREASIDGLPLIRPLVLLNQTDPNVLGVQHTYYFGNELLVAPMNAADSTSRGVYLPAGNWYDYWTNAKYAGGAQAGITWSNSDTTKMPLFVRESSIIPMLTNVPQTLNNANYVNNSGITTMDSALTFLIYPGASTASFNVYDGTSAQCSVSGTVTTVGISSVGRAITLKLFETASPAGAEWNGVRLPNVASQSAFNSSSLGWFYDSTGQFLYVKIPHSGGSSTISFGPDSVGDSATDSWRSYWGLASDGSQDNVDSDGDGLTNLKEYFSGTNPNDPNSRFAIQSVVRQPNGFAVNWQSVAGINYQLQWKAQITDSWQTVSSNNVPLNFGGNGTVLSWTDDGSLTTGFPAPSRFYRVTVP